MNENNPLVNQNDNDRALVYWKSEAERYRTALQAIYNIASKDGVAPELDRCYILAANALMGRGDS